MDVVYKYYFISREGGPLKLVGPCDLHTQYTAQSISTPLVVYSSSKCATVVSPYFSGRLNAALKIARFYRSCDARLASQLLLYGSL